MALLSHGGRPRAKAAGKKGGGKPAAGNAIDRAPAPLRRSVLEADERRRRQARLEGRDSDSEEEEEEWEVESVPGGGGSFILGEDRPVVNLPVHLLLPHKNGQYQRERRHGPDRSGHFGAF